MNYKKFAQDKQKEFGYKILKMNDVFVTIQCKTCGAIKNIQLKSLYKNYNESQTIHNQFCSKYYLDLIRKEFGNEVSNCFHDFYRRSRERCCNPKNKDYKRYKGLFKFNDFTEFYLSCYDIYKEALKNTYCKELTIDCIDGKKGYEPGNIRFVSMLENLQNKENVKPVKMTNIKTGKIIKAVSFGELAKKYKNVSYASALHNAFKNNRLYKKEWKIEYIET